MCMIAGYIGPRQAAPILVQMLRRQEAVNGGFCTGIATCDDGVVRVRKVLGSASTLEAAGGLGTLTGRIGIAHSRTDEGGGSCRAQPYLDDSGELASVGNGEYGVFETVSRPRIQGLASALAAAGVRFGSRSSEPTANDAVVADGSRVHAGDVLTAAVAAGLRRGQDCLEVIRDLAIRWETIQVFLGRRAPRTIHVVNQTQSLVVGRRGDETYLATSRLGFPRAMDREIELPANCHARVSAERVDVERLWTDGFAVSELDPARARRRFEALLAARPGQTFQCIWGGFDDLFEPGKAPCHARAGHRALEFLLDHGRIRHETDAVVGRDGQSGVPRLRLYVQDPV